MISKNSQVTTAILRPKKASANKGIKVYMTVSTDFRAVDRVLKESIGHTSFFLYDTISPIRCQDFQTNGS